MNEFGLTCSQNTGVAARSNGLGKQLTKQTSWEKWMNSYRAFLGVNRPLRSWYPLLVTTLCIRIAIKMVDDFKSRVNWNTTYDRFIRFNICTRIFSILSVSRGVCSNVSPTCDKAIHRQVGIISGHFSITRANWKYLYSHFVLWIVFLLKITYQVGTNT